MTLSGPADREQSVALDRAAADQGVPSEALMALASFQCARLAVHLADQPGRAVAVLAGRGNNGADALGCGRHLASWGFAVRALTLTGRDQRTAVYSSQLLAAEAAGAELEEATDGDPEMLAWALQGAALVVDGLLGTGSSGPAREPVAGVIEALNRTQLAVLAVDLPSGLDASTGERPGQCVRARATVMLAIPKVGCLAAAAREWTGELWVADIGVPSRAYTAVGLEPPRFGGGGLGPVPASPEAGD